MTMPAAAVALVYLAPLAAIAVVDLRTLRAPNRYVYPLIVVAVAISLTVYREHAAEALLGGALAFAVLLVIAAFGRGRMGLGDVKYGVVCGIAVGFHGTLPMLAFAFVAGAAVAVVALGLGLRKRQDVVAFTPFLFLGVLFSLVWSRPYLVS
jgi:prepilin signal peptidase PulO-like enzyme (type II secretory pathway)